MPVSDQLVLGAENVERLVTIPERLGDDGTGKCRGCGKCLGTIDLSCPVCVDALEFMRDRGWL